MNELSRRAARKSSIGSSRTEWPPSWNTLPHGISTGRYIDPRFTRLEHEKLWSRVWQAAARLDEIPEVGNYTVYEIGDQSILVVRVDGNTVKAYYNACPHRGTALGKGTGTFTSCRIICPFHGWRWNLAGESQFVLERQEFKNGQLRDSDVALKEVRVALFAGFVFINMDPKAEPFDEFIAPVRRVIEDLAIAEMHHYWWKSIPVPANWKVAQEAFFEAFHVPMTHPQLEKGGSEVVRGKREDAEFTHRYVSYDVFPHGHGCFYGGKKTPMAGHVNELQGDPLEAMAARLKLLVDGMDAMVLKEDIEILLSLRGKPVPAGSSLGGEYVKALYADAAARARPMPKLAPEILGMWGGEIFVFPNLMILPQAGNAMIYRVRPNGFDPDSCTFEILSTRTLPAADKPQRPLVEHVTDLQDPEQLLLIPRQDLGNIPRIQKGLHAHGLEHTWLAADQEKIILNMHQELDRYLRAAA
ncbi:MAG TPA: aromatic ring-hydroxylating dioxygenase subunit alpha [Steroidobacteraceae bacterium]|nr:aromatic ring-hydroxylating dioxygenase subunit alpha [Steroidobacteraceae bacterium]